MLLNESAKSTGAFIHVTSDNLCVSLLSAKGEKVTQAPENLRLHYPCHSYACAQSSSTQVLANDAIPYSLFKTECEDKGLPAPPPPHSPSLSLTLAPQGSKFMLKVREAAAEKK